MFANHPGKCYHGKKTKNPGIIKYIKNITSWNPAHDPPPGMIPQGSQTPHPPPKQNNRMQMFTFRSQPAIKSLSSDLQEILFLVLLMTLGEPFNFPLP